MAQGNCLVIGEHITGKGLTHQPPALGRQVESQVVFGEIAAALNLMSQDHLPVIPCGELLLYLIQYV